MPRSVSRTRSLRPARDSCGVERENRFTADVVPVSAPDDARKPAVVEERRLSRLERLERRTVTKGPSSGPFHIGAPRFELGTSSPPD